MIKKHFVFLILLFSIGISAKENENGHLLIIGGGKRPDYIMKKFIELAGGVNEKIIILPMASGEPLETAQYQKSELERLGALNVGFILADRNDCDTDSILSKLNKVKGVFISGGDQNRLTKEFLGKKFLNKLHEIYQKGGVIGGTSAGAAVMSEIMITGNELVDYDSTNAFRSIIKNNIETVEGFGFLDEAIIDQHFIIRKRYNRLITLIIENPKLIGIGIDESTGIIVNPDRTFEVIGESQVIVLNPKKSISDIEDKTQILSSRNIQLHILKAGDKYNFITDEVFK